MKPADPASFSFPQVVDFGREICCDLAAAESREWLVTNGLGGYAFGTIAGLQTRSYHGLLTAALKPPLRRILLLAKVEEIVTYNGRIFELSTNRWADGTVSPQGYFHIERFRLEGTTPVWTFALDDALLEKRVFMAAGSNTTYVLYRLLRSLVPVDIKIKILVDYCSEHQTTTAGNMPMDIAPVDRGLRVSAFEGAVPFYVLSDSGNADPAKEWYRDFDLAAERARGLHDRTDHFFAGVFRQAIAPGESFTIVASTEASPPLDGNAAYVLRQKETYSLLDQFQAANMETAQAAPGAIQQLVLAADQFIASRPMDGVSQASANTPSQAQTILAGYPWFGDWGRDAMIALPGLCVTTGRPVIAANILRTFSQFVSEGMLPNQLPAAGAACEYNTGDASLWYFHAVREYFDETNDIGLLRDLFPTLTEIVDAHIRGTRYNIHVDPEDGLVHAGQDGVQLTWMDAKVGNHVVTPRIGKPVEVNALWINALSSLAQFSGAFGINAGQYLDLLGRAKKSFERFWNPDKQFCFDVIDGPRGRGDNDPTLRPNQIFAVSLPESGLTLERQRAVVDVCARELLTSYGLRSLARSEPGYHGRYAGDVEQRDGAYHQGTAWGWLLGPFALAHLRVNQDSDAAMSLLEPMLHHVQAAGVGTASEIFDGDEPFTPNGCIAQAWTVGETLRAWRRIAAMQARREPEPPKRT